MSYPPDFSSLLLLFKFQWTLRATIDLPSRKRTYDLWDMTNRVWYPSDSRIRFGSFVMFYPVEIHFEIKSCILFENMKIKRRPLHVILGKLWKLVGHSSEDRVTSFGINRTRVIFFVVFLVKENDRSRREELNLAGFIIYVREVCWVKKYLFYFLRSVYTGELEGQTICYDNRRDVQLDVDE